MLEISDAALHMLKDALQADGRDGVFRLIPAQDSFALQVATAEAGDVIYEEEGIAVLAAPTDLAQGMDSQKIDIEDTAQGPRLVLVPA
jgi:hypothetical protein